VVGEAQKVINGILMLFFNQPSSKKTPIMNFLLSAWSDTGIPSVALEVGSVNIGGLLREMGTNSLVPGCGFGCFQEEAMLEASFADGMGIGEDDSADNAALFRLICAGQDVSETRKEAARNILLHKPRFNLVGNQWAHP
jgi:hypothetical protein